MAESDTSWHHISGPQIDSTAAREKLYTILALFLASPGIAEECDDHVGCPFRSLLDDHEKQLITRLLIEAAVLIRLKDDLFKQQHGITSGAYNKHVGFLFSPSKNSDAVDLNLRASCNKIIHAKLLNFDVNHENPVYSRHLNPTVYLHGVYKKVPWYAELNIKLWVAEASTLFP